MKTVARELDLRGGCHLKVLIELIIHVIHDDMYLSTIHRRAGARNVM
jgi:hypothetical protein